MSEVGLYLLDSNLVLYFKLKELKLQISAWVGIVKLHVNCKFTIKTDTCSDMWLHEHCGGKMLAVLFWRCICNYERISTSCQGFLSNCSVHFPSLLLILHFWGCFIGPINNKQYSEIKGKELVSVLIVACIAWKIKWKIL